MSLISTRVISRKRTGPLLAAVDGRDPSVVDEARLVGLDALDADAALAGGGCARGRPAAGGAAARPRVEHGHDGRNAIAQPLELQKHQKKKSRLNIFPLSFELFSDRKGVLLWRVQKFALHLFSSFLKALHQNDFHR